VLLVLLLPLLLLSPLPCLSHVRALLPEEAAAP
jgi:hypothetical protein